MVLERLRIKTIAQKQDNLGGSITFGANLQIGYYDQKQAEFKSNKTILDYVWDQYPTMNEKDVRAVLGRFCSRRCEENY